MRVVIPNPSESFEGEKAISITYHIFISINYEEVQFISAVSNKWSTIEILVDALIGLAMIRMRTIITNFTYS